jgi:hypothetical protein
MSARNGDRARFQKDRKRKLRHRQRVQEYLKVLRAQPLTPIVSDKEQEPDEADAVEKGL